MTASPATGRQRAAVVVNPAKKIDKDLRVVVTELCAEEGWAEPLWLETTVEDPGAGQAKQAMEEGVDVVIAAGGDGTVRAVASVLAGTQTPLGLIPLGTGNLLARNLGLDVDDPTHAARLALTGKDHRIDVVRAEVDHSGEELLFLVMAGLGFDAAIMSDTKDELKDRVGWLAYVDAGIRNLPGRPVKSSIRIDGDRPLTRRLRGVTAGNCARLQGGIEMFPGGKVDDGLLDVVSMAPRGRLGWFGVMAGLLGKGRGKDTSVEYFKGKTVEITTESPLAVQLDGDPMGQGRHLKMVLDAGALLVRGPEEEWPRLRS